jgi:hypothetical protein
MKKRMAQKQLYFCFRPIYDWTELLPLIFYNLELSGWKQLTTLRGLIHTLFVAAAPLMNELRKGISVKLRRCTNWQYSFTLVIPSAFAFRLIVEILVCLYSSSRKGDWESIVEWDYEKTGCDKVLRWENCINGGQIRASCNDFIRNQNCKFTRHTSSYFEYSTREK